MSSELPSYISAPFQYTLPPNPDFKYGEGIQSTARGEQWVNGEGDGWKIIDMVSEDPKFVSHQLGPSESSVLRILMYCIVEGKS